MKKYVLIFAGVFVLSFDVFGLNNCGDNLNNNCWDCGKDVAVDNCTARLKDNKLTITSTNGGKMKDYEWTSDPSTLAPWGTEITSVDITGVTSIGDFAFYNCGELKSVNIPNSVTDIGELAFYGCEWLETVILPASIESIGDDAFEDCGELVSVTILATTPPDLGSNAFAWGSQCTIYVPAESVEDYQTEWPDLASRIEAIVE